MSVIVVLLSALFPASAQNYTTDAILKRTTGKIATLECSGIARTKKEAIEMAKKSVIYTYLYNGIDGLNDNKPLLGSKPSAGAAQYVGQLLGTTRYANYIRSCTIADKTNKTAAKDIQVFATIDLYTESLERDLINNGVIGRNAADIALSETQEMIAMPTVMVVPFRKSGQSYEEAIRDNSDMRMAISKVNEGFIKQGVETKDLLTSLNNANTYQVRMGDGMSLDDAILINSGADVSVSVDINQDVNDGGVRVSLTLQAIGQSAGHQIRNFGAQTHDGRRAVRRDGAGDGRRLHEADIHTHGDQDFDRAERGRALYDRPRIGHQHGYRDQQHHAVVGHPRFVGEAPCQERQVPYAGPHEHAAGLQRYFCGQLHGGRDAVGRQ